MTLAPVVLLLAMQAPAGPTVGDTIWISRTILVPTGAAVRPAPWNPTGDVEALGPARLLRRGDSAEIAYPAVAWRPGSHDVTVPGALLLLEGGGVDSTSPYHVTLNVSSVLPPAANDSSIPVQPAVTTVHRSDRTARPLLVFLLVALGVLAPAHWWWRRRGTAPASGRPSRSTRPPVERWAEAGEGRAALAVAAAELREVIARRVPEASPALETEECLAAIRQAGPPWPLEELAGLLRSLDAARFRPGTPADAAALVDAARRMAAQLGGARA